MKALLTVLTMLVVGFSVNANAIQDKFRIGIHNDKIVIDLGKYSHKKEHYQKKRRHKYHKDNNNHHHKNDRHKYSSRHSKKHNNYCQEHRVYHHHHYEHSHSHGDYANHHNYVPDYYLNNASADVSHCWPVQKKGLWKGRKALIGGKMCRDYGGYTYVVPASRYLIKYRGRYK